MPGEVLQGRVLVAKVNYSLPLDWLLSVLLFFSSTFESS